MDKDTLEELERLEKELLAQEPETDEISEEDLLADIEALLDEEPQPAFENPDEIKEPKEPLVYCNYSNDYGRDLQEFADNGGEEPEKKTFGDKLTIGLMITASALSLGIIAMLAYWLIEFL